MKTTATVRCAQPEDRDAFLEMWEDFVNTDPAEPGDRDIGSVNWDRITDPANALLCLIAVDAQDRLQGFLLYLTFPFTWSKGNACYLQDIFVRAEVRGQGYAGALIRHLEGIGRTDGWYKIFWMTQKDNTTAQRLYDRIGLRRDYIRYDLII